MEKRNIFKILKRVLPILCSILVLATALITPISAVVNVSHREEQGNYDLTERSTFPLTVGLAFDIGDTTSIFTTSVGGFGQQNNASSGGSDSFDWLTTESSSGTYLDGQLNYQLLDRQTYSKQFYNATSGKASNGYGTASIQPIKISVDGSTDLTQGKDCSSVVYKLQDVVINSSLIRKGNYVDNGHLDQIVAGKNEKDEFYSPSATDYRYLVPHVILPEISATAGYLGRYNVKATIVDQWGISWELDYSVPIDTRGADTDTYIPFLPMSIFDSYGKEEGERDYNIGISNTVLLTDYQSYLDIDYYEYKSIVPDTVLVVDLNADIGDENTLVGKKYIDLGKFTDGQTFNSWIASADGKNGYTITGGIGPISMSYYDSETGYTYSGGITDKNGTAVYSSTLILANNEYRAELYRDMTTINVAGEVYTVPTGITWGQFINSLYSRDMFRDGTLVDSDGIEYKVADNRWRYVYENLGIPVLPTEKITDNGQYYLDGLTWFFVDNDRYLAPLNSTWDYFVNNEIYDKDRFRWTDFEDDSGSIQYFKDNEWYFVYYDNSIVQQTDTIIEEAHYFIPDKDKLALIGKWIPNPDTISSFPNTNKRLITCATRQEELIIATISYRYTNGTNNTKSVNFSNSYGASGIGYDDYIGFQLSYNSGGEGNISFASGGIKYATRLSLIDSIEFTNNIMDSRVIVNPYIVELMNTFFINEGTATSSAVELLSASAVDVENSDSGIMLLASIPEDTDTMKWQKVEGTEYGRSAVFTLPFYALTDVNENMVDSDIYSYPTFQKYIKAVQKAGGVPTPQIDYTSWLATATSGFLNAELMPNFSIGGVLAILIGFSIVMLFLKFFAGG